MLEQVFEDRIALRQGDERITNVAGRGDAGGDAYLAGAAPGIGDRDNTGNIGRIVAADLA